MGLERYHPPCRGGMYWTVERLSQMHVYCHLSLEGLRLEEVTPIMVVVSGYMLG
jgi:hypothetical protein